MANRTVVKYVLSRLAKAGQSHDPNLIYESQIDKYYKDLGLSENVDLDRKIDALADKLSGLSFDMLVDNKGKIKDASHLPGQQNVEIERLKALVKLYLTAAYVAVKGLVKANARYYIAFAAFDRDLEMFHKKFEATPDVLGRYGITFKDKEGKSRISEVFALTELFLDADSEIELNTESQLQEGGQFYKKYRQYVKWLKQQPAAKASVFHYSKHWRDILRNNIAEAKQVSDTGWLCTAARNNAEHLNVLTSLAQYIGEFTPQKMTSYFQLYHFLMQKLFCKDEELQRAGNEAIVQLAGSLEKYKSPCSDFVKIAFVSLAYNLPRYKNLTVEELFMKDN